ncbi:hypothetical protein ABFS82_02G043200 [Erythranthe guttata]
MLERISMSCNGCRILRKGCNENCILRQSLQGIESPQAQANATVFVAKFFGRAGLMSFLSSVPQSQRTSLFQSLLFEACGRTVNPVNGAVGLMSTGNWHLCQSAVETVLGGGVPRCLPEYSPQSSPELDEGFEDHNNGLCMNSRDSNIRVNNNNGGLTAARMTSRGRRENSRSASPPSDESETTTLESGFIFHQRHQNHHGNGNGTKLLRLFI